MLSNIFIRSAAAFGGAPFRLTKCTALGSAVWLGCWVADGRGCVGGSVCSGAASCVVGGGVG